MLPEIHVQRRDIALVRCGAPPTRPTTASTVVVDEEFAREPTFSNVLDRCIAPNDIHEKNLRGRPHNGLGGADQDSQHARALAHLFGRKSPHRGIIYCIILYKTRGFEIQHFVN